MLVVGKIISFSKYRYLLHILSLSEIAKIPTTVKSQPRNEPSPIISLLQVPPILPVHPDVPLPEGGRPVRVERGWRDGRDQGEQLLQVRHRASGFVSGQLISGLTFCSGGNFSNLYENRSSASLSKELDQ